MPGDGLALTVGVGREVELVDLLELRPQVGDLLLLVRADDVERGETVLDIDTEPRPRLLLVLRGHIGGTTRKVTDVTDRRLDDVVVAEIRRDLLRLRLRLDNDQSFRT